MGDPFYQCLKCGADLDAGGHTPLCKFVAVPEEDAASFPDPRHYAFECSIRGTCPRCGHVCDYSCKCPNGDPEFPLVTFDNPRAVEARSRGRDDRHSR